MTETSHPGEPPVPPEPRLSAAVRQERHLARSAAQRERVASSWNTLEPTLASIDSAVSRVESVRERIAEWARHPLAMPVAALALSTLVGSRRGRRVIGAVGAATRFAGTAARLAGGAAAAGSLLAALRDDRRAGSTRARRTPAGVRRPSASHTAPPSHTPSSRES